MYSLAKDLLFLHGYFTRPEDLEPDDARTGAATPAPTHAAAAEPVRETHTLRPADCGA